MTKLLTVVMAAAVSVVLASGPAFAGSCPKLIKEGRDAAATMKADDPKVQGALTKLGEAQALHEAGKHSDSVAKAKEGLADLGIKKE